MTEQTSDKALDPVPTESVNGPISQWLIEKGFNPQPLQSDHLGVETIGIEPSFLFQTVEALKEYGFDYLECQGGYDEGPGQKLVCFYHLIAMNELLKANSSKNQNMNLKELRIKVFLSRDSNPSVPSLYKIFRGSDWQERETFDMFGINFEGHPHPKRLLMPEDWEGWPLRKDYIQPDFYEMQDAY